MIAVARERELYQELRHLEIGAYLREAEPGSFDLVVAADVFVYTRGLEEIFSRCAAVLRPGGLLAFTIEKLPAAAEQPADGAAAQDGRLLQQSGRYAFSPSLIVALAERYQYRIVHEQATELRRDRGAAIAGLVYVLRVNAM